MGRRAQLALFADNLSKDPQSEEDPAEFLFHVRGVGGVGKSTLLRQWQEAARRTDAVTAVVDDSDVHGVQQALGELVRQLAEQAGPCKEFDKAVEQFRREQAAQAEPAPVEGETSMSSRLVTQAALGAASLIPGAGVVTAMANPDAAAQGLDRLRSASQARARRRGARGDEADVSRAFVAELDRLCRRHRWVMLFFDTWEQTARYLDGWLLSLLDEEFGAVPANVIVVLAGRDELAEREWAPLRDQIADVPLEVFTEVETRALLTSRGVTDPNVVEAVLQLSMGLPLLVELLALARPRTVEEVDAGGDLADVAVERFVQWITDPEQREAVRACALPLQLNEDVFAAAAGPGAEGLWEWLCGQPFVSGRGDFKHYHAVVRASMVRQQRTHSPQGWASAHLRLADTHAAWRAAVEERLPEAKRWKDPEWRRHRLEETYHRLCAYPGTHLTSALEQMVHAAGQDEAVLRQWVEILEQAAQDTTDTALLAWSVRFRDALSDDEPVLACLNGLLAHGQLGTAARSWAHTYRGQRLYLSDRDEEALAEFDRALAYDVRNDRAWARRGETRRWLGHHEQAIADLTAALELDPTDAWALGSRGQAHQQAGNNEQAIADLTAALELDPTLAWALGSRGQAHREEGRYDLAVPDFTAASALDPTSVWALGERGDTHRLAGDNEQAIADFTAALELDPTYAWAFASRAEVHREEGRYDLAVSDFTAALDIDPAYGWALAHRGEAHREAGRYDQAVADFTAALDIVPAYAWALASRGQTHRQAGDNEQAIADFTAALELDPVYVWALGERGETHRQMKQYDQAVADFTAALDINPAYAYALASRGQARSQMGDHDEAVSDLTAALELEPTYAWALGARGHAHQQAGRYDQAVTDFTAALQFDPTYAWALAQRGEAHRERGQYEQAVADFTAALDLDPTYAWALGSRGQAHQQAGDNEQAVADLTAALELEPTYRWALIDRGQAHRQAGRYAEAREDLKRAVEADPEDVYSMFEKLMLDTVEGGGPEVCAEQWSRLFASPVNPPDDVVTRFLNLFRVVLLEPESGVSEATEEFLFVNPDHEDISHALSYLAELAAVGDGMADRARQCHDLIVERTLR
ncbi:tetratricopeptide repeat protein [Streptomyces atrovirens]|uniref:Tetratricopeptide repeat protein n=1 Tax=Streptomyces atrovirens TaxID=285556 RepID=A0ABW0E1Y0_9ACTN